MRIHRVTIKDFRGITDAEIDFPTQGVTVIEGDNEVGKTTIAEAIDLILTEKDDTRKRSVKAVKPIGRDVGPEVGIEISCGKHRFRLRKRWLSRAETVLDILEPSPRNITGREAHDAMREILESSLDEGLWKALRLRQGEDLEQASFIGGSLGRALDLAAGGDLAGDQEDDLWERITAERDRYWTKSASPRAELKDAISQRDAAAERVAELRAVLTALETDVDRVARLNTDIEELGDKQVSNDEELAHLRDQQRALDSKRHDLTRLQSALAAAEAARVLAVGDETARSELAERVDVLSNEIGELRGERATASEITAMRQQSLDAASEEWSKCTDHLETATAAYECARADRDHLVATDELAATTERHERIARAVETRQRANAVIDEIRVDDDALAGIEAAHVAMTEAEARARSGAGTLEVNARGELDLAVDGEAMTLDPEGHRTFEVTGTLHIEVPGTVQFTFAAGGDAQDLARALEGASAQLSSVCSAAEVEDYAAARSAHGERQEALRAVENLDRSIQADLRGSTPEELAQRVQMLREGVDTYASARPTDTSLPQESSTAEDALALCHDRLEDARRAKDDAEEERNRARGAVDEQALSIAKLDYRHERIEADLRDTQARLDVARSHCADDELLERVAEAKLNEEVLSTELRTARNAIAAQDPDSLEALLTNATQRKEGLEKRIRAFQDEVQELRGRLAAKGEEGLANELDDAEGWLERTTGDLDRIQLRADAALRLHNTFEARREEAHSRYVAPFRERIEQLARLVFGKDLEVTLDSDLSIASRTLAGITIPFESLSVGAREQLGMISRLAAASITSSEGGAPVMFDDALGWSDPDRLERMGAVLATAGRDCQVIVLTCTPGRYDAVGNANVVRLAG